jgi:hypothetical protein
MKKATCKDLKGACDTVITGATPDEMAENCKKHAMEQIMAGEAEHQAAAQEMMAMSKEDQQKWFEEFKASFDGMENAE